MNKPGFDEGTLSADNKTEHAGVGDRELQRSVKRSRAERECLMGPVLILKDIIT